MSEHFDPSWLALREPADHRSRAPALADGLTTWSSERARRRTGTKLEVVDLASGAGSNVRYLAPRLPGGQRWTLVDHDPALLRVARAEAPADVRVECLVHDLASAPLPPHTRPDVVTASALLDLVSEAWLGALTRAVVGHGAAALFALTYDGSIEWGVPDPADELVRSAVDAHQHGDKGFGPALGPDASAAVAAAFGAEGYRTEEQASPWRLEGPADVSLARALVDGWREAAIEIEPARRSEIEGWARRRHETIDSGAFALTVGHRDLLALPAPGLDRGA